MPETSEDTAENHFYVWGELHWLRKPAAERKLRTQKKRRDLRFQTGQIQTGTGPFLRWRSAAPGRVVRARLRETRSSIWRPLARVTNISVVIRLGQDVNTLHNTWGWKQNPQRQLKQKAPKCFITQWTLSGNTGEGAIKGAGQSRWLFEKLGGPLFNTVTAQNLVSINEIGLK